MWSNTCPADLARKNKATSGQNSSIPRDLCTKHQATCYEAHLSNTVTATPVATIGNRDSSRRPMMLEHTDKHRAQSHGLNDHFSGAPIRNIPSTKFDVHGTKDSQGRGYNELVSSVRDVFRFRTIPPGPGYFHEDFHQCAPAALARGVRFILM